MPKMKAEDRRYALRRLEAGDYLLISNDARWVWRIRKYTDGPSSGLDDWSRDKEVWGLWVWDQPVVLGETEIKVDGWDRWEFVEGPHSTRDESIRRSLEIDPSL